MIRGLYTSQSGMMAQWNRMSIVSNNLANINTTAYKRDGLISKSFPQMLLRQVKGDGVVVNSKGSYDIAPYIGRLGTGVEINQQYTQFDQGQLRMTDNDLDFALVDKGFFVVKTPDGMRYTRHGSFVMDKDGFLVTKDGFRVQGEKGDIQLKKNNFKINDQGQIFENPKYQVSDVAQFVTQSQNRWESSRQVNELLVVQFYDERALSKQGHQFFTETIESGLAESIPRNQVKVHQNALEMSNVNPVVEMTKMIEIQRVYEANQRAILTHDALLSKAVNQIAKL